MRCGLAVSQNSRIPFALSAIIDNLPTGTYNVGLCGSAAAARVGNWNLDEFSYTSAMVFVS
jgi:hypothetical protein